MDKDVKRCGACGRAWENPASVRWEPFGNAQIAQPEGWTLLAYESGRWRVHRGETSLAGCAGGQEAAKAEAERAWLVEWRKGCVRWLDWLHESFGLVAGDGKTSLDWLIRVDNLRGRPKRWRVIGQDGAEAREGVAPDLDAAKAAALAAVEDLEAELDRAIAEEGREW